MLPQGNDTLTLQYSFYNNFDIVPTLAQQAEALEKLQQRIWIFQKDCESKIDKMDKIDKIDKTNKKNRKRKRETNKKNRKRKRETNNKRLKNARRRFIR